MFMLYINEILENLVYYLSFNRYFEQISTYKQHWRWHCNILMVSQYHKGTMYYSDKIRGRACMSATTKRKLASYFTYFYTCYEFHVWATKIKGQIIRYDVWRDSYYYDLVEIVSGKDEIILTLDKKYNYHCANYYKNSPREVLSKFTIRRDRHSYEFTRKNNEKTTWIKNSWRNYYWWRKTMIDGEHDKETIESLFKILYIYKKLRPCQSIN
jgi:hypothetical protein